MFHNIWKQTDERAKIVVLKSEKKHAVYLELKKKINLSI